MRLLYGTNNKAKIEHMKEVVKGLPIEILGLNEIGNNLNLDIEEAGDTPLENACIKAQAYYSHLKIPVFSCDSGLYFDGVEERDQPGVYARRKPGYEMTDEEMIDYYSILIGKYGGKVEAQYKNAIHLIIDENQSYSCFKEEIFSDKFYMHSDKQNEYKPGFPLDSLSSDKIKRKNNMNEGFRNFFKKLIDERKD